MGEFRLRVAAVSPDETWVEHRIAADALWLGTGGGIILNTGARELSNPKKAPDTLLVVQHLKAFSSPGSKFGETVTGLVVQRYARKSRVTNDDDLVFSDGRAVYTAVGAEVELVMADREPVAGEMPLPLVSVESLATVFEQFLTRDVPVKRRKFKRVPKKRRTESSPETPAESGGAARSVKTWKHINRISQYL